MTRQQLPPTTWEAILKQAFYESYLQPLDKLIEQKLRYFESIENTDRFGMSDADNQRIQRRIEALADEITLLDNLRNAIPDMAELYWRHLTELQDRFDICEALLQMAMQSENNLMQMITSSKAA